MTFCLERDKYCQDLGIWAVVFVSQTWKTVMFQSKGANPAGWVGRQTEFTKARAIGVAANLSTRDPPALRCSKEEMHFPLFLVRYIWNTTVINFLCVVSLFCLLLSVLLSPTVGLISILIIKLFLHYSSPKQSQNIASKSSGSVKRFWMMYYIFFKS